MIYFGFKGKNECTEQVSPYFIELQPTKNFNDRATIFSDQW